MVEIYRHGTRVLAEGGPALPDTRLHGKPLHTFPDALRIEGRLIGDHECLDGSVHVLTDEDEALTLNGWLFVFEILAPPAPRPRPAPPITKPSREARAQRPAAKPNRSARSRPRPWSRPWSRPWYLRNGE